MSRRGRISIALSTLVLASGCASIVGFEDLEYGATTDGGADDATAPDGAGDDASRADGAITDAGRDRATPIGCGASTHDFCEDFEQPISFTDSGWQEEVETYPGTLTRESTGDLLVECIDDGVTAAGFRGLSLTRPFAKKASGDRNDITIKWRVLIEDCPPAYSAHARLNFAPGDPRFFVDISLGERDGACWAKIGALYFAPDGGFTRDAGLPDDAGYGFVDQLRVPAAAGQWHDIAFALAQAQDGLVTASLRVDDRDPTTIVFKTESDRDVFSAFFGMAPGFRGAGRIRIDDVRVDYTK